MPNISKRIFVFLGFACLVASPWAMSQERGGRGEDSGRRGGRDSGRGDRTWDVESFIKRLDTNGNGKLESSEMSGRTARYIEGLGFDISRDVDIGDVVKRANGEETDSNKDASSTTSSSGRVIVQLVPGFETLKANEPGIPGFGTAVSTKSLADISKEYGEQVSGQVERALRRYDKNENGVLDADELAEGQWGNPSPQESDSNGDGALTRQELAERYKSRENASSRNDSSSDNSNSRGSSEDSSGRRSRFSRDRNDEGSNTSQPAASTSSESSTSSTGGGSSSDRMRSYADSLVKQYDGDGDGQLNKEEVSKMRRIPEGADGNGDGMVSAGELTDALVAGNKTVSTSAPSTSGRGGGSNRSSNRRSDSNPESGNDSGRRNSSPRSFSFNSNDENRDGQVQMHEFATDWTDELLNEFRQIDKNDDGVITADEYSNRDK